jgi:hypothetical protein
MFPDTNTNWQAFFEVQKLILKNAGKVYAPGPAPARTPACRAAPASTSCGRLAWHRLGVLGAFRAR